MNYYQHHIGDFNNATRHLSLTERAIYRDLLDMYYDTEQAIDASNLERLARRLQCTTEEQNAALVYVLEEFFKLKDGAYVNNRCEREIAEYHSKRRQASEAGKASAKKRAEKKQQNPNDGSSDAKQSNNQSSTTVDYPLNENLTDVQPTINHEPVTNIIDSSSNAQKPNFPLPPIQFSQYQAHDHRRYTILECVGQYPLQQDFIDHGIKRFPEVHYQDMISMFTNYGDFFASKGETAKNTASLTIIKIMLVRTRVEYKFLSVRLEHKVWRMHQNEGAITPQPIMLDV